MRMILPGDADGVVLSPLEALPPFGVRAWAERRIRRNLPLGHALVIDDARDGESRRGWPVLIFFARVVDPAGATVEHRVVVLYRFIHHAGIAEARASRAFGPADAARVERLLDASPDFSGQAACLADLVEAG